MEQLSHECTVSSIRFLVLVILRKVHFVHGLLIVFQPFGDFSGVIGEDDVSTRSLERDQ
jgi:hypothetical protein